MIAAGAADAQVKRSLSGTNLRFQIGGELQIPIAKTRAVHTVLSNSGTQMNKISCNPKGGIKGINPTPMAEVTTWPTGRVRVLTSRFTLRGPQSNRQSGMKYTAKVIGVKTQNPVALQVVTYFQIQIPKPSMTLTPMGAKFITRGLYPHTGQMTAPTVTTTMGAKIHPGVAAAARKNLTTMAMGQGRTGINTVSWCPGSTASVTQGKNPGCADPFGGGGFVKMYACYSSPAPCPDTGDPNKKGDEKFMYKVVKGYMKYTRTGKMLGGPANGMLRGHADLVVGVTGGGAVAIPLDIGTDPMLKVADPALGGSFGQIFQQNAGKGQQFLTVMANPCGIVTKLGPTGVTKAVENRTSASFGGPLTQGSLTIAVATNTMAGEFFKLRGYDKRGPAWGAKKFKQTFMTTYLTPMAGTKMVTTTLTKTRATPASMASVKYKQAGQGRLQLVTGSVSLRSFTGSNVNQGVLNYKVPEPALAGGAAAALLVLVLCHRAMNRKR